MSEQQATTQRRGPGRPRKHVDNAPPATPVEVSGGGALTDDDLTLIGTGETMAMLGGISIATLWRLIDSDPEFPAPIRLRGKYRYWMRGPMRAYVRMRAERAEREKRERFAAKAGRKTA
jgi:predicted DNA-binding transcriptional regulator AlpA